MSDENENVRAGSETPSEVVEPTVATPSIETAAAEPATEQKVGDACTCPDGREGTLSEQEGQLVCLPNQG